MVGEGWMKGSDPLKGSGGLWCYLRLLRLHRYREQTCCQRKGVGVGKVRVGSLGISRCKLLYTEWIDNKVLLYSAGNYIQCPVINPNEGTSLVIQWLGLHTSKARGTGSVTHQETKILQEAWHNQKRKKKPHKTLMEKNMKKNI